MKAIVLETAGGIENLNMAELSKPTIKRDEVLVAVKAISINPVDWKVRSIPELLTMICGETLPVILGWDISGTVVAVGEDVTKFSEGDRVFGMVNFPGRGNAYAEFVSSPEDHLALIPTNSSFEEAAATTLAALTALQVLTPRVKKGDRILIHAGSGGVGHFAIQIAKNIGATVITTSSTKNRDFVMSLGADEHIDYNTIKFEEVLSDIDFVFDMFNGDILANSVKVIKEGGTILSLPTPDVSEEIRAEAAKKNVTIEFQLVQSNGSDINTLAELLASGTVKPKVSQTFPFDKMGEAHTSLESGRTVGKIIVTL